MKKWILSATAITIFLACGDRHRKSTDNLPEDFAGAPEDEGSSTNPPPQPTPTPTPIVTPTALPIPDPNPTPAPVPKLRILMTRYAFVSGETRMLGSIALDANSKAWPVPPNFSVKIHVADENCGSEAVSVQDSTVTAVLTAKDGTQRCSFQLDLIDEKGEILVSSQRNLDVLKADKVKLSQTPAGHYYHDMGLGLSKLGAEYDPKTRAIGEH
ncbi:MAG: hypothetical protein M3Q07_02935, partial [Pseudobdellovibrionaceae bacterium]|nr:hypothetical protein [Pseudobdellovibrionaceae bacterium]